MHTPDSYTSANKIVVDSVQSTSIFNFIVVLLAFDDQNTLVLWKKSLSTSVERLCVCAYMYECLYSKSKRYVYDFW